MYILGRENVSLKMNDSILFWLFFLIKKIVNTSTIEQIVKNVAIKERTLIKKKLNHKGENNRPFFLLANSEKNY